MQRLSRINLIAFVPVPTSMGIEWGRRRPAPSLSDAEKIAILGGNAAKLLGIKI